MDVLPQVILTRILSYLSGEDVSRSNQLNSTIRQVISENRVYLRMPSIAVEIFNNFTTEKINGVSQEDTMMNVYRSTRHFFCAWGNIYTSKPNENFDNAVFFHHFYEKGGYILRDKFKYMLEHAEIRELCVSRLRNRQWIACLADVVKSSSCRIRSIFASPSRFQLQQVLSLLHAVANQKEKSIVKPALRIECTFLCERKGVRDLLKNITLRELNDLSSLFSSATFECPHEKVADVLEEISKEWSMDPFQEFNFHLKIHIYPNWNLTLTLNETPGFEVFTNNLQEFLRISFEDKPSSASYADMKTGNVLLFEKKNGEYRFVVISIKGVIN